MFINRKEAASLLTEKLLNFKNKKDAVIVTIPRGGVPVGYVIAKKLNLPLEIVLSKKIGHPFNKEYAIGAVTIESRILSDAATEVSNVYIEDETKKIRALLKNRYQSYYGDKTPLKLENKTVIIVDDGIATGNTLISCIELIQQQKPSEIIVALPVAPVSALKRIKELPDVNATICLQTPIDFMAVGQFYEEFPQVSDQEVIRLLKQANNELISSDSNL